MSNRVSVLHLCQSPKRVTPREGEVLDLAHLRRADIAAVLGISEQTVKAHRKSAYAKLGAENSAGAVLLWQRTKELRRAA